MAGKKPARKASKGKLTPKQEKFVEGVARHGNKSKAAQEAGYAHPYNNSHRLMENDVIRGAVERRQSEAMRRAQIHTDVIVGSLAEIATSSLADVIPEDEFMSKARELGTDHLIKKLRVKTRYIPQQGRDEDGNRLPDVRETTHEFEMYSRLDALSQLRDTFGMKQEPRANDAARIESAIQDFIRAATEKGYALTYDEARAFIEPRMASELVQ
jgi:hypothetical protein